MSVNPPINAEQLEDLFDEYTKVKNQAITLRSWLLAVVLPLVFALETSLQDTFAYKLPGVGWERVEWSIVLFATFSGLAVLATAAIYYTRLRWNHPPAHFDMLDEPVSDEMYYIMEKMNTWEFAATVLPFVWILPFVLFQLLVTEINTYYHPKLDYDRVVSIWSFTGMLGFLTLCAVFIMTYLHGQLLHPRRTKIKHDLVYQMVALGAIAHGYIVKPDGSICAPEEGISDDSAKEKKKKKRLKQQQQRGAPI